VVWAAVVPVVSVVVVVCQAFQDCRREWEWAAVATAQVHQVGSITLDRFCQFSLSLLFRRFFLPGRFNHARFCQSLFIPSFLPFFVLYLTR
jgi:hypothetical protein